jgi:MarR family transcriptional regulator, organic hydroperoxide resistance regulator
MLTRDPDITRLIDRLETRGLIQRGRSDQDRRVVRTRITQTGLDLLAEMDEPCKAWGRKHLGHLTDAQLKDLISLLELARAGVGA